MNSKEIKHLIQNGEKIDVEFKESKNALTKDVFDTVCSFNNRNGGHILLGVNDKREIVGVSKDKVDKVIKEFTTAINNPQKCILHFIYFRKSLILMRKSYLYKST